MSLLFEFCRVEHGILRRFSKGHSLSAAMVTHNHARLSGSITPKLDRPPVECAWDLVAR